MRIVLVGTLGALNLGGVARVMKNFALSELHLVTPQCSPGDEEARRMAVHALDVLDGATVSADLPSALVGCERVVGATARPRTVSDPFLTPGAAARWLFESNAPAAYLFGPEDRGLSNEELSFCQRYVQIPTSEAYPSLNLAQAVGICAYELFTTRERSPVAVESEPAPTAEALEGFYSHLQSTLLTIGYLQEQTVERKLEKFRRLFNRAGLTAQEVALLRGVLRQVNWANERASEPGDSINGM